MNINSVLARPLCTTIVAAALSFLVTTGLFTAVASLFLRDGPAERRHRGAFLQRLGSYPNGSMRAIAPCRSPFGASPAAEAMAQTRYSASEPAQRSRARVALPSLRFGRFELRPSERVPTVRRSHRCARSIC